MAARTAGAQRTGDTLGEVSRVVGFGVLVVVAAGSACGRSSALSTDSGAADGPHDGASSVSIPGVTGLVAANGLPIPDPPLQDPCTPLAVTAIDCAFNDTCPALTCDCGGHPRQIEVMNSCAFAGRCLTGVSCPAICAMSDLGASVLPKCVYAGSCDTDADCTRAGMTKCLRAPDGTAGHCVSGQAGSDCYRDADCPGKACVAIPGGLRMCQDPSTRGSICNRDDQCAPSATGPGTCLLQADQIFGPCTNGTDGTPCFSNVQCLAGATCLFEWPGDLYGFCSSGITGAPCVMDTDCHDNGFCVHDGDVGTKCQTGQMNAVCIDAGDCLPGLRCLGAYPATCQY